MRTKTKSSSGKGGKKSAAELELALRTTRETLQSTIEELQTSNEELRSTNEEMQSSNEELQSTNEELETAKEELQSLNEESSTVNAELQSRIDELSRINDDIKNLLDSTEVATVFLDLDLCISRFTPRATRIVPLEATDVGRPIGHFASNLRGVDLAHHARQVLEDLVVRETEVASVDGNHFIMRVRPYRTVSNVIDGVVMTFENITLRWRAEEALRISEELHRTVLERFLGIVYHYLEGDGTGDRKGQYRFVSGAVERVCGYTSDDFLNGRIDWTNLIDPEDRDAVMAARAKSRQSIGATFEIGYRVLPKEGRPRQMREIFRHTMTPDGLAVQGAIYDGSIFQR
jgi:PAS domain-containing protein